MTTAPGEGTTGRYLVLLRDDAVADGAREITRNAGIRMTTTADAAGAATAVEHLGDSDGLVLHELGVAVVSASADQAAGLVRAAEAPGPIAAVEPERVVRAIESVAAVAEPEMAEATYTWGLQAVGAATSKATGAGVRVAVLDTGVDLGHPDLAGRTLVTKSFVPDEEVQDRNGHGTHCIGTSCGPREPATGPGYGVAPEADIYAGKVLSDEGWGTDGGILAGISWAIANGCRIVSMSLGAATQPGQPYSRTFQRIARRAVERGTLIIAAAGNESDRPSGHIAPVGHPANCPAILAVGAVDVHGAVADFSCGTVDTIGQVDLVGPGVDIYSSWPMPRQYRRISGTSMATPHVAGVAALIARRHNARSWELWARLAQTARRSPLPSTDIGAGLVRAPK